MSPSPEEQEYAAGDYVMTADELDGLCSEAMGLSPVEPPDEDLATVGSEEDDFVETDDVSSGASAEVQQILPSGTVMLGCSGGDEYGVLAAVNARANTLLWERELDTSAEPVNESLLAGGNERVYLISVTDHPAEGLKKEYFTREVTAIDALTGTEVWTQPLEPNDKQSTDIDGQVFEGTTPDRSQTIAVVNVNDYSAYAAEDGTPLWRVPELDPTQKRENVSYVGFGRTIGVISVNDEYQLVGTDLGTGKVAWTTPLDYDNTVVGSADWEGMDGTSYWYMNGRGFDAYDVLTGKLTAHGFFPTSFSEIFASPHYTVAQVDDTLRAYRTGEWGTVLWSLPSDSAVPSVATEKVVAVSAEAGNLLLDMSDGSTITEEFPFFPGADDIIDGLYLTDEGDIMELGQP